VKIFLSYPSEERSTAERLNYALLQQGHDVFFDREDLAPGHEYDQMIAASIAASDLVVFLLTPGFVRPGRYTLTEVKLTEERFPTPDGRVLPVLVQPTDISAIPPYLRAVNFLVPTGEVVAEAAHEVKRLAGRLSLASRLTRRLRSPVGLAALGVIVALAGASWIARPRLTTTASGAVTLPPAVRSRARAVVGLADSGFAIATANPPQLVRFSESGAQIGDAIDLMGEPVFMSRTPKHVLVATRGRDGVMVFEASRLRVFDSTLFDPSRVEAPSRSTAPARWSGDIQSVAVGPKGELWVTTGDRDGEPGVLRYRPADGSWNVPTFAVDTAGFGPDANGVRLRDIRGELWGARARGHPSALYHFNGFIRIDRFDGRELGLVRCAHDVAAAPSGNVLFLGCDNALQEVSVESRVLTVVRTRPTLPPDAAPGTSSYDLLVADSTRVIVALNTVGRPDDRPVRARVAEVDSVGGVRSLLDVTGAVVTSLGVTSRSVIAVLRRADGSADAVVAARSR
jgi:hypothetical protein